MSPPTLSSSCRLTILADRREGDSRLAPGKITIKLDPTVKASSRGRRPGWTLEDAKIAPLSLEDEAKAEEEYGAYPGPRLNELLVVDVKGV